MSDYFNQTFGTDKSKTKFKDIFLRFFPDFVRRGFVKSGSDEKSTFSVIRMYEKVTSRKKYFQTDTSYSIAEEIFESWWEDEGHLISQQDMADAIIFKIIADYVHNTFFGVDFVCEEPDDLSGGTSLSFEADCGRIDAYNGGHYLFLLNDNKLYRGSADYLAVRPEYIKDLIGYRVKVNAVVLRGYQKVRTEYGNALAIKIKSITKI